MMIYFLIYPLLCVVPSRMWHLCSLLVENVDHEKYSPKILCIQLMMLNHNQTAVDGVIDPNLGLKFNKFMIQMKEPEPWIGIHSPFCLATVDLQPSLEIMSKKLVIDECTLIHISQWHPNISMFQILSSDDHGCQAWSCTCRAGRCTVAIIPSINEQFE